MNKIAIVIPVYNASKYLSECIESVLQQTYTNFCLFLVDDGSCDGSDVICDEYAMKDNRIVVIHQENSGVTKARERGVLEVTDCEFITFVDADDVLVIDALETLLFYMQPNINIVLGEIVRFRGDVHINETKHNYRNRIISCDDHRRNMILGKDAGPVAKLYRRCLFDMSVFDIPCEINMGEDVIANVKVAFCNEKDVVLVDKCVYYYRQHSESCMHTFKGSPEYEEKFLSYVWHSVPEKYKQKYIKCLIEHKIMSFDYHFGCSIDRPTWIGSNFHSMLLLEIKKYKFRALPIERMLLIAENRVVRRVLIFIKRVKNKLCKLVSGI